MTKKKDTGHRHDLSYSNIMGSFSATIWPRDGSGMATVCYSNKKVLNLMKISTAASPPDSHMYKFENGIFKYRYSNGIESYEVAIDNKGDTKKNNVEK